MGKRGPKSTHPSGFGSTAKGYHRTYDAASGRQRLVHELVWEREHGPVPDGFHLHHHNEDKQDNRLDNLRLVTALDHKRMHFKRFRRAADGSWECQCRVCEQWKPATIEHFYFTREGWIAYGRCRPCHIAKVVRAKQQRRARVP